MQRTLDILTEVELKIFVSQYRWESRVNKNGLQVFTYNNTSQGKELKSMYLYEYTKKCYLVTKLHMDAFY